MKIRTVYFKVSDLQKASAFWQNFIGSTPHKAFETWHEFMCGEMRLGLMTMPEGDHFSGSGCVPVFEYPEDALQARMDHALSLGARLVFKDPSMKIIVLCCPQGHEFELCGPHP